ncbi:DUF559 domain-containing protein [Demequina mangrovi]|uniref:Very-short-patch-repair endonuclease n=1 Tax=Demequina mangrovi TaxID=1043493 RepID=A0A1H6X6L4_9MICO|nr:DUF559 domain-containing protein [Demequina mangrovi]SEJ22237.1 Very-short-patch-repair endonuclease [Demequina mangrovi]
MRLLAGITDLDRPLTSFLGANAHAFTRAELLGPWTRHALDAAVRAGTVARVLPGVYCGAAHRDSPSTRGEALNLWAPRTLVTGALALHLCTPALAAPRVADLAARNGDRLHPPAWVRVHQAGVPLVSSCLGGVNCVTPERALLDAWRYAPEHERRNLLWEALWARACTWRQVERELERAPRVAGRRDLERVLGWFAEGATTPLEVLAKHEVFTGARFDAFERQVDLVLPSRRATVDMLHRRARVVVELDGDAYHSTRKARDEDRNRQTDLVAAGYAVVRFGWRDVVDRPEWCRERLLTVVAGRLTRPGSR